MTNIAVGIIPASIQKRTLNTKYVENFSTWLRNLISPTTETVGGKEAFINASINSPAFFNQIEKTREDFIRDHNNYRKYPKIKEEDWK